MTSLGKTWCDDYQEKMLNQNEDFVYVEFDDTDDTSNEPANVTMLEEIMLDQFPNIYMCYYGDMPDEKAHAMYNALPQKSKMEYLDDLMRLIKIREEHHK